MERPIYTRHDYPCLNCTERSVKIVDGKPVRCHSTCEKYLAAKAKRDAEAEEIHREERNENIYMGYHMRNLKRIKEGRRHD